MKSSSLRRSVILTFSFEAGISTFSCSARLALRMRVRRSATGSLIMVSALLPARLDHARDLALEGQFPEADAAGLELPQVPARPAAQLAAGVGPRFELGHTLLLHDQRRLRHVYDSLKGTP